MKTTPRWNLVGVAVATIAMVTLIARSQPSDAHSDSSAEPVASLHSDKADYTPGETATLTGVGFQSGEPIDLRVTVEQPVTGALLEEASFDPFNAGHEGDFTAEYVVPAAADGMMMRATASGTSSGASATTILNNPAWVDTDMDDYPPGAIVYIAGGGFFAGETVQIQVLHVGGIATEGLLEEHTDTTNDGEGHETWTMQANENGELVDVTWTVCEDDCVGALLELTATGLTSGLGATARFTDAILTLYADAARTTQQTAFPWGATVYARGTALIASRCARIEWFAPGAVPGTDPAYETDSVVANASGVIDADLVVPQISGIWQARVQQGSTVSTCTGSTFTTTGQQIQVFDVARAVVIGAGSSSTATADNPFGDNFVNAPQPTTVQGVVSGVGGVSDRFTVEARSTAIKRAFLRFDLSSLPSTATITDAVVRLWFTAFPISQTGCTVPRTFELQPASASWSEGTIVYGPGANAQPGVTGSASTASVPASGSSFWRVGVSNDANDNVTADVQSFLAASQANNFGWRLKDQSETATPSNCLASYASTENTNVQQRPVLLVDYITNVCGNGIVESPEQCDLGANNGTSTSCCTASCAYRATGQVCRTAAGQCDVQETCNGSSAACPVDNFASSIVDCTGTSQGGDCDLDDADHCKGDANECVDVYAPVHVVCREAVGQCDVDDHCTATSGDCPANEFADASVSCTGTSQGGACDDDAADHCDGNQDACVDIYHDSSYVCRGQDGQCDVAEYCTTGTGACPTDTFAAETVSCTGTSQGGLCDNDPADHCAGTTTNACVDVYRGHDSLCRSASNECDEPEYCTTGTGDCPANVYASAAKLCTGTSQGGGCDIDAADHCNGGADVCVDVYQDVDYVCREGANQCDADEKCTGTTGACPTDVDKPDGTECDDGSACTEADECSAGVCGGETVNCNDDDTCSTDSCNPSTGCEYECIEQPVSIDYNGDRFVSTSGPTAGSAQVVLAAKITPDTTAYCGDLTDLQVRFRVYAQKDLSATPVANVVVPVNSNGEAVKLLSLTVGNSPYTVRASIVGNECWSEDYDDACLTVDYGSTERRVTGGGFVPSLLSRNEKSNFGFTVGFNKNGTLKGNSIYMVRGTDGYNYLVKSTAWTNGELTFTQVSGKLSKARFSGKGVIQKIDANTDEVVNSTGNVSFVVDLFDGDQYTPKQKDQYAIRVILQNNTQWFGSSPTLQQLGGGNVTIFAAK